MVIVIGSSQGRRTFGKAFSNNIDSPRNHDFREWPKKANDFKSGFFDGLSDSIIGQAIIQGVVMFVNNRADKFDLGVRYPRVLLPRLRPHGTTTVPNVLKSLRSGNVGIGGCVPPI